MKVSLENRANERIYENGSSKGGALVFTAGILSLGYSGLLGLAYGYDKKPLLSQPPSLSGLLVIGPILGSLGLGLGFGPKGALSGLGVFVGLEAAAFAAGYGLGRALN